MSAPWPPAPRRAVREDIRLSPCFCDLCEGGRRRPAVPRALTGVEIGWRALAAAAIWTAAAFAYDPAGALDALSVALGAR